MMTADVAERYMEGPNAHLELRSRVVADVGEKTFQQIYAPPDNGEVQGGGRHI